MGDVSSSEREPGKVSARDFAELDLSRVTVVDLRDDNLMLAQGEIPGAKHVALDGLGKGLSSLPNDKPVYVICARGDFSPEVAEILADRGFEAYDVEGGFAAYRAFLEEGSPLGPRANVPFSASEDSNVPTTCEVRAKSDSTSVDDREFSLVIDAKNLKCPGPIVKVADELAQLPDGARVKAEATEDAFASDIRVWCDRTGNRLESLEIKNDMIKAVIVKGETTLPNPEGFVSEESGDRLRANGKTFIVFSGDLDKTIAAFIMANGAAAMGREVTMFFTFWGLNVLRRPERIRTHKTPIGRAFGAMMPRGTRKLGLSRMNFLGAGAKMIRTVMKRGGISSLEELMESARAHGVRLVACQMSMEIMGITREELLDGVELGGVATFLGSGEQSDMSLFI